MTTTIKFFCPAGHALAVSARLGGTRAACPVCGAEVLVPVIEHSEAEALGGASPDAAGGLSQGPWAVVAEVPPATGLDPLDEAPSAVWYVRPPSGGQFGPASGLIMKSWIRDGRVPGESLVWRAGWEQWQSAAAVFQNQGVELAAPEISIDEFPDRIAPSLDAIPAALEPKAATAVPTAAPKDFSPVVFRRKLDREHSKQQMVLASLVLLVIAAVLVAILLNMIQ